MCAQLSQFFNRKRMRFMGSWLFSFLQKFGRVRFMKELRCSRQSWVVCKSRCHWKRFMNKLQIWKQLSTIRFSTQCCTSKQPTAFISYCTKLRVYHMYSQIPRRTHFWLLMISRQRKRTEPHKYSFLFVCEGECTVRTNEDHVSISWIRM